MELATRSADVLGRAGVLWAFTAAGSRVAALEAEVAESVAWSGLLAQAARDLGAEHEAWVAQHVVPLLEASTLSIADGDWDGALVELAALTAAFDGQPLFRTPAELDALMDDDDFTLVLDPNPGTEAPEAHRILSST